MTTLKAALRQLTDKKSKALPPMPPPENITGKRSALIWGTEGSGAGAVGGSSAAGGGAARPQPVLDTWLYEIEGTRTYFPEVEIFDEDGLVSVDAEALLSCQVQDAKGNTATVYFTTPF